MCSLRELRVVKVSFLISDLLNGGGVAVVGELRGGGGGGGQKGGEGVEGVHLKHKNVFHYLRFTEPLKTV